MFFMKTKKRIELIEKHIEMLVSEVNSVSGNVEDVNQKLDMILNQIEKGFSNQKETIRKNSEKVASKISDVCISLDALTDGVPESSIIEIINQKSAEIYNEISSLHLLLGKYCNNDEKQIKQNDFTYGMDYKKLEFILESITEKKQGELLGKICELEAEIKSENESIISIVQYLQNEEKRYVDIRNENTKCISSVSEIKKELEKEKESNALLLSYIQAQNVQLQKLSEKIDAIHNSDFKSMLEKKNVTEQSETVGVNEEKDEPVLTNSHIHNLHYLENCMKNIEQLSMGYSTILGDSAENTIYFKILTEYGKELKELIEEVHDDDDFEAEEIADRFVKIIKSTILKNFAKVELGECLDKYLQCCKFKKVNLEVGEKVNNRTYKYISQPLQRPVNKPDMNNVIIMKKHDAYYLCYKDEENVLKKVISGECEIGIYSEKS